MKVAGVYTITHDSGKVYVGSSVDIRRRWQHHRRHLSPTAYSLLGFKFTDEQRAKVSAALIGRPKSPEHRANLAGRPVSDSMRATLAANGRKGRGRPKPPAHREKIGAAQRGSANHAAKLTEDDVRAIRARLAAGERGRHLAEEFGVHESIVSEIKSRRRWQHVA